MDRTNVGRQPVVGTTTLRRRARQPRIVATAGDTQYVAHRGHLELGLVRLHELEDLLESVS